MPYNYFLADPEVANKESLAALGRWIVEGETIMMSFV